MRAGGTQIVAKTSSKGQHRELETDRPRGHLAGSLLASKPTGIERIVTQCQPYSFRVSRAISLIESDYSNSALNLEVVGQRLGITKSHLCRIFKREVGIGLPAYVCKVRARAAEKLLGRTPLSIKEITTAVGFIYVTQLDRAFKTMYGCVPREYRRKGLLAIL